jgi:hypothetical protein
MEFSQNLSVIMWGFLVWLLIAPRFGMPRFGDWFLAYMVALLFSLIASAEIMMVKPVAFFFTVGGVFAFCYVVARSMLLIKIRK